MDSSYGCQRRRLIGAGKAGRCIVAIDPLARRATTVYDPAGRAIVEINANGGRQTTTYDAAGRRIGLRDPRGYRMSFTYDAVGQAISEVNAVGSRMTFSYDANSQRVGRLDPRGISTTWTYDAANRMRSRRQPGGQIVTWTHDPTGNLVQLETPLGRYTRTFDPADNVLLMTTPEDQTLQWVRDPLGRRKVLIDPDGGRTTYTCNGLGQVTKLVNAHLERTTTVYDPAGRETRLELDNGTVTTTIYDAAGQTVRVAHVGFENFDYTYDAAGRRTGLVESTGDRLTWSYDPTGQLVGEARSGANAYATTYVYDPSGNRLVEITETNRTTSVYDGFNRLLKSDSLSGITTYSYDPAGNRARLEEPSGDLTTYTWNAENHLIQTELPSGDVVTTLWDPINKNAEERIVRRDDGATTTHYLRDNNNILRETDDVGAVEAEYTYVPQPYSDLVSQRREAESHFYQFDALGSATGLTDETGAATDEYRYKAFGETVSQTGATENPNQWVAREGYRKDEATGDYYLRKRHLPPRTGQFTSADPKGLEAGDSNFYRYVGNDPVGRSDPSGLKDIATICKARNDLLNELSCTAPETPASGRAIDKALDGYNQSIEARLANLEIRKRELERNSLCFENRILSWAINALTGVETTIDLALAFLPVFSDVRDVAEVLSGTDIVTKEDLSRVERLITVVLAFLPLVSGSALRKFGKYGDRLVDELEKVLAALERLRDRLRRSKACEAISKRVTESIDLLKEKLAELEKAGQELGDSLLGPRLRPSYEGVPTSCPRPDNGCNALSTRRGDGDGGKRGDNGDYSDDYEGDGHKKQNKQDRQTSRPAKKPKFGVPDGTLDISKHPDTRDRATLHTIKHNLRDEGVGAASWVGVTPDGLIVLSTSDGCAEILSHWTKYL